MTSFGVLGIEGKRNSPTYGITEYPLPPETAPRLSFFEWTADKEFAVQRHQTNNPNGYNGKTHGNPPRK